MCRDKHGIGLGGREGKAPWRWEEGEKAGTTVTASTTKIKFKKELFFF